MRSALVLFLAVAFFAPAVARDPEEYAPKGAGYKVTFPGKPQEISQGARVTEGSIDVKMAAYGTSKGESYLTAYNLIPGDNVPLDKRKEMLAQVITGVKGDNGKEIESKDIETKVGDKTVPGKSFVIDKGKGLVKGKVYVSEKKIFQVMVNGPKDFVDGKDATAFLESFKLVD